MKKGSGRHKARNQAKKVRKAPAKHVRAALSANSARPRSTPPPLQAPQQLVGRQGSGARGRLMMTLPGIDKAAIAIVVVPLVVMALLAIWMQGPRTVRAAIWRGDLAVEAMPVMPDGRSRAVALTVAPPPVPWRGDLALEDMPIVPDARSRAVALTVVPPPMPWQGELALEDMPVQPDPASRMPFMRLTGAAIATAAASPICLPDEPFTARTPAAVPLEEPAAFGRALARAARAQTEEFVIYNSRYMSIAYPRGDTQPLYGVCTDVVIRAYRAVGIDLQELIHTSRLGRGDPSIDHRRVEVMGRFFERHGLSFEFSEFAEDYLPGDIVTYHRPQGRVSQHHIAVVTDRIAPSGRPLIVHNRGWGPQLEDALFVDRITGHYRFAPRDAEAYARSRPPRATGRHRTADVSSTKRR